MERPSDRDRGSPGDGGIGCQDDGVVGWCKDVLRQKERATNRCVDKQRDGSNSTDREADSWCFTYTFKTLHPKRRPTFLMRFLTWCALVNQSKQTKTPKNSYHMTAPHDPPAGTVKRSDKEANKGFQISLFLGVNTEDVHLDDSIRSVSTYLKQSFVLRNTCVCETEAQHLIWW